MELYKAHRPALFKHVYGQDAAVASLEDALSNGRTPHAFLFSGPAGVGKTTLARILAKKLGCGESGGFKNLDDNMDFVEINAADFRGVDTIRDIRSKTGLMPIAGK